MYFKVYNSDGDTFVKIITKEQVVEELNERLRDYGNLDNLITDPQDMNNDTNYWGSNVLYIKGDVVNPTLSKVSVD